MSKIRLHGSSSGYVEIAPAAAASNNTLTAPSTVGEIIAKDAAGAIGVTSVHTTNVVVTGTTKVGAAVTISESGIEASGIGITCANINGTQIGGRRNLILNGAMQIYQRGSLTGEGFSVDRMRTEQSTLDENVTTTQGTVASGTTPYSLGFRNTWKIQNGNQTSSAPNDVRIALQYKVEAQDMANSGWNYTSSSSFITLSFWVKSSVAQNFYGLFQTNDGTEYNYPFETGSLTADTWTKVVKTIPGNSNLQFDNDSNSGIKFELNMIRGVVYTDSGVSLNTWAAYATGTRTPDQTTTWYSTNDATFEITGIQLEVGPQPTPFEHRSFGDELTLCKRYCRVLIDSSQTTTYFAPAYLYNSTSVRSTIVLDPEMRASPTIVCTSATNNYRFYRNGTHDNLDDLTIGTSSGKRCAHIYNSTDISGTAGHAGSLYIAAGSTGFISLEAEL